MYENVFSSILLIRWHRKYAETNKERSEKIHDRKSEGCHYLVKHNKAMLVTGACDILEQMNWNQPEKTVIKKQVSLFREYTEHERQILASLQMNDSIHIDDLFFSTGIGSNTLASALLTLEMDGIIRSLPGKRFSMVN